MKDLSFTFLDPGKLIDNELELVLVKKLPADPVKKFFPMYEFEMRRIQSNAVMGIINLRIGYNENIFYGGHVGYGVLEEFRGSHLASRSVKLLFPFAKKNGLNLLIITCNPDNIASRKTCERAGGKLIDIVDLPAHNDQYKRGERQKCRYEFDL